MRNILRFTALALAITSPAAADVTLSGHSSMKGGSFSAEGATTTFIKGTKMRIDSTFRGDLTSTIFDVDGQKMISINHKKMEAEVFEMATFKKSMAAIDDKSVDVTFVATGGSKTIAGEVCDGYTMAITLPLKQEGMPEGLSIVLTGPVFVSKKSAARDEYSAFYAGAIEKGFFFTSPAQAKAQPGVAKAFAALYGEMAKAGVAYETTMQIKFEGGGMVGSMLNKMTGSNVTTSYTSVSSDPIADSQFEIPADYKVK